MLQCSSAHQLTDGVAEEGEEEVELAGPVAALRILILGLRFEFQLLDRVGIFACLKI